MEGHPDRVSRSMYLLLRATTPNSKLVRKKKKKKTLYSAFANLKATVCTCARHRRRSQAAADHVTVTAGIAHARYGRYYCTDATAAAATSTTARRALSCFCLLNKGEPVQRWMANGAFARDVTRPPLEESTTIRIRATP